jgi:hypothetical protein
VGTCPGRGRPRRTRLPGARRGSRDGTRTARRPCPRRARHEPKPPVDPRPTSTTRRRNRPVSRSRHPGGIGRGGPRLSDADIGHPTRAAFCARATVPSGCGVGSNGGGLGGVVGLRPDAGSVDLSRLVSAGGAHRRATCASPGAPAERRSVCSFGAVVSGAYPPPRTDCLWTFGGTRSARGWIIGRLDVGHRRGRRRRRRRMTACPG